MQLLKWLSVTDRFYKIYLDKQLAPYGINNSQYMFLIKICRSPGILQDSLLNMFYVSSKQYCTDGCDIGKAGNDYTFSQSIRISGHVNCILQKEHCLLLTRYR